MNSNAKPRRAHKTAARSEPIATSPPSADVRAAPANLAELAELFGLLAEPLRLRILHYLLQRAEINVAGLCELLKQSQPAISYHLSLLRNGGLIDVRKEGHFCYYRLVPERFSHLVGSALADFVTTGQPVTLQNYGLAYHPPT